MIRRLLIANRGEIACRIARTARAMGIETVAVFAEVDAGAAHVAACDFAHPLTGDAGWDGYLDGAQIIAIARGAGADAIHPGYGFLSENPDFADAVTAAGLVFVGPPARAIRAMGLKDAAKLAMGQAGVPVVPGYHGEDRSAARLLEQAGRIGYPVLIKAVAGGGGKGMRVVETAGAFAAALDSCRNEARAAFGNDAVLIEKLIPSPRHIEFQVFGDSHGNVVHLLERDCSLQRRHQKVLEEAPAPGMTDELRAIMGAAAIRAARAIGYVGAGTVEFIADGSGPLRPDGFWFMEMNTRLQVEHPVTEAILGLDLVEWQLRIAAGAPLPVAQDDIRPNGHSVEVRLYAEDPAQGFLPATGRLAHLVFPDSLRVDSGVRQGDTVSPHFDPMIAKLIAHGADRETAIARARHGLERTELVGLRSNLGFLARLLDLPELRAGAVHTGLIAKHAGALAPDPEPSAIATALAALVATGVRGDVPHAGFTLWAPLCQTVALRHGGAELRAGVTLRGRTASVRIGGADHAFCWRGRWMPASGPALRARRDRAVVTVFGPRGGTFHMVDPLAPRGVEVSADRIVAPMPGRVLAVEVVAGQKVARGDRLAVLEAMKMEHVLSAGRDAVVAGVLVETGDQVTAGSELVVLEPEDAT